MREWTDRDYAQAAIDMLPGTVEEIEKFMRVQKVGNNWKKGTCPLDRWFTRWTGCKVQVGYTGANLCDTGETIPIPSYLRAYMRGVDLA